MMEVGPWRWDGKSEQDFWVKSGGWDEYTTVVYGQFSTMGISSLLTSCVNKVDQPAGTGFSYTSTDRYVHTIDIVSSFTLARTPN
jgi:carboxypeptidase D